MVPAYPTHALKSFFKEDNKLMMLFTETQNQDLEMHFFFFALRKVPPLFIRRRWKARAIPSFVRNRVVFLILSTQLTFLFHFLRFLSLSPRVQNENVLYFKIDTYIPYFTNMAIFFGNYAIPLYVAIYRA